jgi:hypothetical protein
MEVVSLMTPPAKQPPGTHRVEGLVDPTAGLMFHRTHKSLAPARIRAAHRPPHSTTVGIPTLLSWGLKSVRFVVILCNLPRSNLRREVRPSISQLH